MDMIVRGEAPSFVLWIDEAHAAEGSVDCPTDTSGDRWSLRRIEAQEGAGLLKTVKQGFKQGAHRIKLVVIEQSAHALPQQAFAAQLGPHRLEQGTAQLLGLLHEKRQHHHRGKDHGEIFHTMAVIVLEVIALIFQRIEGLIFDLRGSRRSRSARPGDPRHRWSSLGRLWSIDRVLDVVQPTGQLDLRFGVAVAIELASVWSCFQSGRFQAGSRYKQDHE